MFIELSQLSLHPKYSVSAYRTVFSLLYLFLLLPSHISHTTNIWKLCRHSCTHSNPPVITLGHWKLIEYFILELHQLPLAFLIHPSLFSTYIERNNKTFSSLFAQRAYAALAVRKTQRNGKIKLVKNWNLVTCRWLMKTGASGQWGVRWGGAEHDEKWKANKWKQILEIIERKREVCEGKQTLWQIKAQLGRANTLRNAYDTHTPCAPSEQTRELKETCAHTNWQIFRKDCRIDE